MNIKQFQALVAELGFKQAKAIASIDGQDIVDADGNPIDIQTIDLSSNGGEKAEDEENEDEVKAAEEDEDETVKRITGMVIKGMGKAFDKESRLRIGSVHQRSDDDPKAGFNTFGEFAKAVKAGSAGGGGGFKIDKRLLVKAPTTYSSEAVGADGGFAVPPDFMEAVRENTAAEDSLLARTDNHTSATNTKTIPVDNNTDWDTTNGVQAANKGEGQQLAQSKIDLDEQVVRLNKITSLVPVTDELLEDTGFLGTYLARKVGRKIDFEVSRQIINGTGGGQMLGIINAPCTVSVAKVASQDATSFVAQNVVDMWSRLYGPHAGNSVWLVNQDVIPQLQTMSYPGKDLTGTVDTSGGIAVYTPSNGFADAPFGTLYGRPVIPHQACSTLGSVGDVILADLSEYMTLTKAGGIQAAQSGHLYFDYDMQAFKFCLRVGGQPWWPATVSALNGSATYSPFVVAAVRA